VFNLLGTLYAYNLNSPKAGVLYLKQAVDYNPNEIGYEISLIDAYRMLQMYDKALCETNKILAVDPNNKYGLYMQGAINFKIKNWQDPINSWDRLKRVDMILFGLIEEDYNQAKNPSAT